MTPLTHPYGLLMVEDDLHFADWAIKELSTGSSDLDITLAHDLAKAREWLATPAAKKLELAVIDLHLGQESGIDLIEELAKTRPEVGIMVVTSVETPDEALRAIRAGAQGYLLKMAITGEFVRAVQQLREGGSPINPGIAHLLLSAFRQGGGVPPPAKPDNTNAELMATLSGREVDVLRLLARGYSDKEVAAQLGISPSTVDTHVRGIYRKFQVNSRSQLRKFLSA